MRKLLLISLLFALQAGATDSSGFAYLGVTFGAGTGAKTVRAAVVGTTTGSQQTDQKLFTTGPTPQTAAAPTRAAEDTAATVIIKLTFN